MMRRRMFCSGVMTGVVATAIAGAVGLVGGCSDTPPESTVRTPEQEAAAKTAQERMKEAMAAKKKAGATKRP